jgi:hypothetical protein
MDFPKTMDYKWLAGFFDGEGCVGIYYRKPGHHSPNGEYFLRCQITQNNEPSIRWIAKCTNGNVRYQPRPKVPTASFGDAFVIYWTHRKAEIFLKTIAPYCILKSEEIKLAFKFLDMKVHKGNFGYNLPENYFANLKAIKDELHNIKKTRNGERI